MHCICIFLLLSDVINRLHDKLHPSMILLPALPRITNFIIIGELGQIVLLQLIILHKLAIETAKFILVGVRHSFAGAVVAVSDNAVDFRDERRFIDCHYCCRRFFDEVESFGGRKVAHHCRRL